MKPASSDPHPDRAPPYAYGNIETQGFALPDVPGFPEGIPAIGLAGHYYEHNTGLVYMHHRWYSPRLGTFLTPDFRPPNIYDPSTFTEPYAYAKGNPIMYWDPDGLRVSAMTFEKSAELEVFVSKNEEWKKNLSGEISGEILAQIIFSEVEKNYKTWNRGYITDNYEAYVKD